MLHVTITRDPRPTRDAGPAEPKPAEPKAASSPHSIPPTPPVVASWFDPVADTGVLPRFVSTQPVAIQRSVGPVQSGHVAPAEEDARRPGNVTPPGRERGQREPAPFALRVGVLGLCAVWILAIAALTTAHLRPSWVSALRGDFSHATATHSVAAASLPVAHFALVSSSPSAVTYAVPVRAYSLALSIDHPCWVVVKSPATAATPLLASTLMPGTAKAMPITGTASVVVEARANSITISSGTKVLGVIRSPALGVTYTFVPSKQAIG
jgi:hypothetical protein